LGKKKDKKREKPTHPQLPTRRPKKGKGELMERMLGQKKITHTFLGKGDLENGGHHLEEGVTRNADRSLLKPVFAKGKGTF